MYMMTPAGGFLHPVWQDWAIIESFWPQIFYITKAAHIFRDFGALFINILFKIKTDLSTFWAHFEILRNFLFQHLVALFASWISLSLRVSIYLEPHFHVRFWRSFCAAILRFTKQPSTGDSSAPYILRPRLWVPNSVSSRFQLWRERTKINIKRSGFAQT